MHDARRALCLVFLVGLLAACGPTTRVLKLPGASPDLSPVAPQQIEVYRTLSRVKCDYRRIALVEAQESESIGLTGGVSQLALIRAARKEAGKVGANALVVDTVGMRSFTETEVEADSTGYKRTESQTQLGQGVFLAILEDRPCEASDSRAQ